MPKAGFTTISLPKQVNDEMDALAKLSGRHKSFHLKEMWEFYRDTFGAQYRAEAKRLEAAKQKIAKKQLSAG